jgi:hypothetical protein
MQTMEIMTQHKINFGQEGVVVGATDKFRDGEPIQVTCIERGAPIYPYYCWNKKREVGEWLHEKQIQLNYGIIGSVEYWRKIKALNAPKKETSIQKLKRQIP